MPETLDTKAPATSSCTRFATRAKSTAFELAKVSLFFPNVNHHRNAESNERSDYDAEDGKA